MLWRSLLLVSAVSVTRPLSLHTGTHSAPLQGHWWLSLMRVVSDPFICLTGRRVPLWQLLLVGVQCTAQHGPNFDP